jgi:hypothetical protein
VLYVDHSMDEISALGERLTPEPSLRLGCGAENQIVDLRAGR